MKHKWNLLLVIPWTSSIQFTLLISNSWLHVNVNTLTIEFIFYNYVWIKFDYIMHLIISMSMGNNRITIDIHIYFLLMPTMIHNSSLQYIHIQDNDTTKSLQWIFLSWSSQTYIQTFIKHAYKVVKSSCQDLQMEGPFYDT